ncbi:hypothetical protein K6U44_15375 [Vibrio parahaemolyticus]|uniref:hypothetical protein n=1 Tax=Vibrio parahaemolyticus TaxID=670 RepID=UPI001EEBFB78|nr:hypothetical protein [Vibrio parahaemolyticus]MCG6461796.1 hypothetical protein [Vibrio parahaemolyticus]
MHFSDFLQKIILKQSIRKELLAKIQLSSDYFSGLDAVTFSRWVNGVTSPAPFKQILIASVTGNLDEYISAFLIIPKCKKTDDKYNLFLERFSNYYFELLYDGVAESNCIFHAKGNCEKISEKIGLYTRKYKFYNDISKSKQLKYDIFYVGEKKENFAISFVAFTTNVNSYLDLVHRKTTKQIEVDDVMGIVDLSFFRSKKHYEMLIGLLFNFILDTQKDFKKILFLTRGYDSLSWHEYIGGELICRLETSNKYGNIYLFSVEIKKILNNSILLSLVKHTHKLYNEKYKPRDAN